MRFAKLRKYLLQTLDLLVGLFEVSLQACNPTAVGCLLDPLGQ
jgi:hypothetical protein